MTREAWFQKVVSGHAAYWRVEAFARLQIRAVFFLRTGGVSRDAFSGLNLGYSTRDSAECVRANRELALASANLGPWAPVCGRQVHGTGIRRVNEGDAGRGWLDWAEAFADTDGFMTDVPGLPLTVSVADCLPVLLADEQARAVAALHAGWRGVAAGIVPKAIGEFREHYKVNPDRIYAALGPCIGPDRFIIQDDALRQLQAVDPGAIRELPDERIGFDLWHAVCTQLRQNGVNMDKVQALRECTASHPEDYYSYRRDQETGRMMAMIQIDRG